MHMNNERTSSPRACKDVTLDVLCNESLQMRMTYVAFRSIKLMLYSYIQMYDGHISIPSGVYTYLTLV